MLRTGFICSTPKSHVGIDNVSKVVVWCDQVLNSSADDADDAHERTFDTHDPGLIGLDETAHLLRDGVALEWFAETYRPKQVFSIIELLSLDDFGLGAEAQQRKEDDQAFRLESASAVHWWRRQDATI